MLYILNNNEKIVGLIQHNIDKNCKNIYFDDLLQEDLQSGAESLTFSAILENNITNEVCVGNYIAFKKENEYKLMQIIEVEEDKIENGIIKNIYCESAGLELINEVYTGLDMESVNFRMFLENILQDTFWEVGNIDVNLVKNLYVKMENKSIYNLIQEHSNKFGAEIAFRVEIKNNKVVGRYIDAYVQRGKDVGKRLEVNKDVKSLTRKMNLMDYATKLIGRGKDGLTFKDISDNNLDKPLGQDFIVNNEAFSRLNYRGKHITKVFEYDTTDPHELLLQTKKALDEYSKIKIEYSIESNIIDFSDIGIGDTIYISDLTFNPPLFVSARICNLETSKTNDNNNKVTLSNYKEIKSSISKFPIGSNDILDGAITKGKIDTQYLETIKTDILVSTKIEVGTLIANKADMEDLFAINATVVNLIADNVTITGKLTAVEGEFDTLQSEVGKIQTLVNGNLTSENIHSLHLTSSSVTVENGFIKNAMIDNLDVSKINAGDISTNKFRIKSDDGG
ncbi:MULTISPECIES: phage tail spike protein, partial [Bacillota]